MVILACHEYLKTILRKRAQGKEINMSGNYDERDVTFDIIEEIGVISTQQTGWTKEINLVRWNGGLAKYDIRDWDPLHERMSRGITLHEDEMRRVLELMKRRRTRSRNRQNDTSASAAELTASTAQVEGADAVAEDVQEFEPAAASDATPEYDSADYSEEDMTETDDLES